MAEHGIIFQGWKIRRIQEWDWTRGDMQTRRVLKPQPPKWFDRTHFLEEPRHLGVENAIKRYGIPGDKLWSREKAKLRAVGDGWFDLLYAADEEIRRYERDNYQPYSFTAWTPSIHMPRWASRHLLPVTGIRIERVQDISEGDAFAEGCQMVPISPDPESPGSYVYDFADLWDSINAKRGYGWDANPFVWKIRFGKPEPARQGKEKPNA